MSLSAKTEYACIAVLELALHYNAGKPVRIRDIAEANGIPARFLVQILLQLKGSGLVNSTRGAAGGYHLARDPSEITLGSVMALIEGQSWELVSNASEETVSARTLMHIWQEVADVQREMLSSVTFADLAARVEGHTDQMYYI
jgi:Rrf2 family protein